MSHSGNLYREIPKQQRIFPQEIFTRLLEGQTGARSSLHIDRIVSTGHSTDWMTQDDDEWVILLEGDAQISFQQDCSAPEEIQSLVKGDYLFIPRSMRHRLVHTSTVPAAIWLAVHSRSPEKLAVAQTPDCKQTLRDLLVICKQATEGMSKLVQAIYGTISATENSELSTVKTDDSAFTIADGIVQTMLFRLLHEKVGSIVGEEDETCVVNLTSKPYNVGDVTIPEMYYSLIDETLTLIDGLSRQIDSTQFKKFACFIDPIDGTKEFASKRGEQCSTCIGFANDFGVSIAGIIYRPITGSWAAGCPEENYFEQHPAAQECRPSRAFLGSNSGISPFLQAVADSLGLTYLRIGGAGNKALMLIEGLGSCYILDRGASRWDTCAAEAILRARGGTFWKLNEFLGSPIPPEGGYTYLKSALNLDYEPTALQTKSNSFSIKKDDRIVTTIEHFKPYSNLAGHVALAPGEDIEMYWSAVKAVRRNIAPNYT